MKIIQPTAQHLDSVSELFDAYRVFYRQESDPEAAGNFIQQRLQNQDSVIYLALQDDQPAGFVQLYPLFSSVRMARIWLLNDLYVRPEFRGKQIGKALIERAKTLARESEAAGLLLETEKTNTIGNNLYPTTGFDLVDGSNFYFWTANK